MENCKNGQTGCCDKAIKGIMCDVHNCKYHAGESKCCAPHISVGPQSASSSSETACVTFQPKGE